MRRLNRVRLLLGAAAAAVAVAACAGEDGPRAAAGSERQSVVVGRVEIEATPIVVEEARVRIRLVLDTHSAELDSDIADTATLVIAGDDHDGTWRGDGPGGHHREGVLSFSAGPRGVEPFELHLSGFSEPVTFRWPPADQQ